MLSKFLAKSAIYIGYNVKNSDITLRIFKNSDSIELLVDIYRQNLILDEKFEVS